MNKENIHPFVHFINVYVVPMLSLLHNRELVSLDQGNIGC